MKPFTAHNITASYGDRTVIRDISFQASPGSITGIAGPNGSGKSTLIRSLCNLIPHQGFCGFEERFEQLSERQLARLCSYLPQKSGLSLNISVLDAVQMAHNPMLGMFSQPTDKMRQDTLKAIESVGLKGKEHISFLELSGGERRLCLLARALVPDTPLLIMDEPENSLDPSFRIRIMETVRNRVNGSRKTAVISLHDMNLALNYCDRILLLKEGRLLSVLEPQHENECEIERKLSGLFGEVWVKQFPTEDGSKQLVMLSKHPAQEVFVFNEALNKNHDPE